MLVDFLIRHFRIMPGGSLDKTNYFLLVIFIITLPYKELVRDIPFIYDYPYLYEDYKFDSLYDFYLSS